MAVMANHVGEIEVERRITRGKPVLHQCIDQFPSGPERCLAAWAVVSRLARMCGESHGRSVEGKSKEEREEARKQIMVAAVVAADTVYIDLAVLTPEDQRRVLATLAKEILVDVSGKEFVDY